LIKLMSIVSLVIAPTLAQMNTKKAPVPLTPAAGGTGQIKTIQVDQPVASINKTNTVHYYQ